MGRLGNTKGERASGTVWPQEAPGPQLPWQVLAQMQKQRGLARGSSSSVGAMGLIPDPGTKMPHAAWCVPTPKIV